MNLIKKVLILYMFLVSQLAPYQVLAAPKLFVATDEKLFSNPVIQDAIKKGGLPEAVVRDDLYLKDNTINKYRIAGIESAKDFNKQVKIEPLVLMTDPSRLMTNQKYSELFRTEAGRIELSRQFNQSFSGLSASLERDIFLERRNVHDSIRNQVVQDLINRGISEQDIHNKKDLKEKIKLEINRRFLEKFTHDERNKALNEIRKAQKFLSNGRNRALYNFKHGLAVGEVPKRLDMLRFNNINAVRKGSGVVKVRLEGEGVFGKRYEYVNVERSGDGLKNVKPVEILNSLKKGSIEVGKFGMAFLMIMYASAQFEMLTQYKSNPQAFEKFLDELATPAFLLSFSSFFIGGAAVGAIAGTPEALVRKSIFNLNEIKNVKFENPRVKERIIKTSMAGVQSGFFGKLMQKTTSYPGLAGGLVIAQLVHRSVNKIHSCRKILALKSGEYNEFERQRIEQACKQGWAELANEIASSPQTWMQVMSIWSAKALLTFFMSKTQFSRFTKGGGTTNSKILNSSKNNLIARIVPRGIIRPVVSVALSTGGTFLYLAAFVAIFEVVFWGLQWGYEKVTIDMPTEEIATNMRRLMHDYRNKGWDIEKLCQNELIAGVKLLSNLRSTGFSQISKYKEHEECVKKVTLGFIDEYKKKNQIWKNKITEPVQTAINNWIEYTFQAVNLYKASYLLYKDISEQIRLQRTRGKIEFNRRGHIIGRTNGNDIKINKIVGYANSNNYNHPLPLFRTDPFFGWNFRITETNYIPYPKIDTHHVNWEERSKNNEMISFLEERFKRFKKEVLPEVINKLKVGLESEKISNNNKENIQKIVKALESKKTNDITYGLHLLSKITENELTVNPRCLMSLHTSNESISESTRNYCFFSNFQKNFLDTTYWKVDKDSQEMTFKKSKYPYFAGYQTSKIRPYGVKPLANGQRFFIDYHKRLKQNGIDPYYFDSTYDSLTDYLLKSMMCGVDIRKGESMLTNKEPYRREYTWDFMGLREGAARMLNWESPKYKAPKIPLKTNFNACSKTFNTNRGAINDRAWISNYGFYNYIEDVNNPGKNYGGIVHLLYEEANDEFVNNFDTWWRDNVKPEFEIIINKVYEDYFLGHLINEKLQEALTRDNNDTNCLSQNSCVEFEYEHKHGVAASIKQEIDTYFVYILGPMVEDMPLDERYYKENNLSPREKITEDLKAIRLNIYDILNALSTKSDLKNEKLKNRYNRLYKKPVADEIARNEGETIDMSKIQNQIALKTYKLLLNESLYNLGVLFKTSTEDTINFYFDLIESLIRANSDLTEDEVELALDDLEERRKQELKDYEDDLERKNKVLIQYQDWPTEEKCIESLNAKEKNTFTYGTIGCESPTLIVVRSIIDGIREGFDNLIQARDLEYLMSNVDDL